jgi:hypothetical protein
VLPPIGDDPQRQFARTPYTASFARAGVKFSLASVHILWGKNPAERLPEITAFAQWMHYWAVRPNDWNSNLDETNPGIDMSTSWTTRMAGGRRHPHGLPSRTPSGSTG